MVGYAMVRHGQVKEGTDQGAAGILEGEWLRYCSWGKWWWLKEGGRGMEGGREEG